MAVAAQQEMEGRCDEYMAHMQFGSDYDEQKFADRFRFDELCEGCHVEIGAALVVALNSHAKMREHQGEYGEAIEGI